MNKVKVLEALNDDLSKLMEKRTKAIENNETKVAVDMSRLVRDTIELIARVEDNFKGEDEEEITVDGVMFSVNEWIRFNLDMHIEKQNLPSDITKKAYKVGFENAVSLVEEILKTSN